MFFKNPLRKRQQIGSLIGIGIGLLIFIILPLKASEEFLSLGPMNTGHEGLSCNACHTEAKGNLLQQIQTNITYTFGARKKSVDFGTENVETD